MNKFTIAAFSFGRSFYDAWIVLQLWGWFIVPMGAPRITFWHAYGLDLCFAVMGLTVTATVYARTEDRDNESISSFAMLLVGYTMALLLGFGAHLMMGVK